MEVKETKYRKRMKKLGKKNEYFRTGFYGKIFFFVFLLIAVGLYWMENPGYQAMFIISLAPMAVWSISVVWETRIAFTPLEDIAYTLQEAKKNLTLYRVRENEDYLKKARHLLIKALVKLEKIGKESKERPLLEAYAIHTDLESGIEALKEIILPRIKQEKELRKTEDSLEKLAEVFIAEDLKKLPQLKEELLEDLGKQSLVLSWDEEMIYFFQKPEARLCCSLLSILIISVPLILKTTLSGLIPGVLFYALLLFLVFSSILISAFQYRACWEY